MAKTWPTPSYVRKDLRLGNMITVTRTQLLSFSLTLINLSLIPSSYFCHQRRDEITAGYCNCHFFRARKWSLLQLWPKYVPERQTVFSFVVVSFAIHKQKRLILHSEWNVSLPFKLDELWIVFIWEKVRRNWKKKLELICIYTTKHFSTSAPQGTHHIPKPFLFSIYGLQDKNYIKSSVIFKWFLKPEGIYWKR